MWMFIKDKSLSVLEIWDKFFTCLYEKWKHTAVADILLNVASKLTLARVLMNLPLNARFYFPWITYEPAFKKTNMVETQAS